jgi:hypothetical protein
MNPRRLHRAMMASIDLGAGVGAEAEAGVDIRGDDTKE